MPCGPIENGPSRSVLPRPYGPRGRPNVLARLSLRPAPQPGPSLLWPCKKGRARSREPGPESSHDPPTGISIHYESGKGKSKPLRISDFGLRIERQRGLTPRRKGAKNGGDLSEGERQPAFAKSPTHRRRYGDGAASVFAKATPDRSAGKRPRRDASGRQGDPQHDSLGRRMPPATLAGQACRGLTAARAVPVPGRRAAAYRVRCGAENACEVLATGRRRRIIGRGPDGSASEKGSGS